MSHIMLYACAIYKNKSQLYEELVFEKKRTPIFPSSTCAFTPITYLFLFFTATFQDLPFFYKLLHISKYINFQHRFYYLIYYLNIVLN